MALLGAVTVIAQGGKALLGPLQRIGITGVQLRPGGLIITFPGLTGGVPVIPHALEGFLGLADTGRPSANPERNGSAPWARPTPAQTPPQRHAQPGQCQTHRLLAAAALLRPLFLLIFLKNVVFLTGLAGCLGQLLFVSGNDVGHVFPG